MAQRPDPGPHPPLRWFADRVDGRLSTPRTTQLEAHLAAGCAPCDARDAALRRTIAALKSGPLPEPPAELRRGAARLHTRARVAAMIDSARRVVARLVHDGLGAPALALRAAPGDERRVLWAMDRWEIDACLVTGARGADLLGQVVPLDDAGGGAIAGELAARLGSLTRRQHLADDGRFTFRDLAPGVWTIEGRIGATEFTLPPLVVERAG
jgi:anti-sigma factor RsiW